MSTLYAHRENETWFNVVTYFKILDEQKFLTEFEQIKHNLNLN